MAAAQVTPLNRAVAPIMPALPDDSPAFYDVGSVVLYQNLGKIWDEVQAGAVIRVLQKNSWPPRVRCWITGEAPPGTEPEVITVRAVREQMAYILDAAGAGACFQVTYGVSAWFRQAGHVCGFIHGTAPAPYAGLAIPARRARGGHRKRQPWHEVLEVVPDE